MDNRGWLQKFCELPWSSNEDIPSLSHQEEDLTTSRPSGNIKLKAFNARTVTQLAASGDIKHPSSLYSALEHLKVKVPTTPRGQEPRVPFFLNRTLLKSAPVLPYRFDLSAVKNASISTPQLQVRPRSQELRVNDWFNKFDLSAVKTAPILTPQLQVRPRSQELRVNDWFNKFDLSAVKTAPILTPQLQVRPRSQELRVNDWFNKFDLSAVKTAPITPQNVGRNEEKIISTTTETTTAKSDIKDVDLKARVMTEQEAFFRKVTERC